MLNSITRSGSRAPSPKHSPQTTDWTLRSDQQLWFDRFKIESELDSLNNSQSQHIVTGSIKFKQFQEFLTATLYKYFRDQLPLARNQYADSLSKFTYQQELQLFKIFDAKNDHKLDFDEFSLMCQLWIDKIYNRKSALVIVDVQNDFIDGSLALIHGSAGQDGAEVVPVVNELIETNRFDVVVYTQDWHPSDHIGFYDNLHLRKYAFKEEQKNAEFSENNIPNNGTIGDDNHNISTGAEVAIKKDSPAIQLKKLFTKAKLFDTVLFDEGRMEQKLWPVHCVQNSWGAQLHPKLKVIPGAIHIYKGTLPQVDAYSAFWDNMRLNETGLRQELCSRQVADVFFCGLALDYCVSASAIDSARAGFMTFVIEDACRGIDCNEIERSKAEMRKLGIIILKSDSALQYLAPQRNASSSQQESVNSRARIMLEVAFRRATNLTQSI